MRVMRTGRLALATVLAMMLLGGSASGIVSSSLTMTIRGLTTSDRVDEYHATV